VPAANLAAEIAALPESCALSRSGDLTVYLVQASDAPSVLRELGRLREITFRAAGEGTGKPRDLDEFDQHYLHLFVWNARKQELVGAYRLARTDVVRKQFGVSGLYTATLFRYSDPFLDRMGPAIELGRSFVRQEYQKGSRRCCCCGKESARSSTGIRNTRFCSVRSASATSTRQSRAS